MNIKRQIPLLVPDLPSCSQLTPWLEKLDENRWYTNFGPLNAELSEKLLEEFASPGCPLFIQTVANCTLGIELALMSLGIRSGAKVLVPAFTFAATGTAIIRAGLEPIFCDVDPDTWILTPEIAEAAITKIDGIEVIIPVATFGHPQDTLAWDALAKKHGISVLIDAAGAFGNQSIGESSSVIFSLHATKALGAGEGGFLVSSSPQLVRQVKNLSNFGIEVVDGESNICIAGTNAKFSEYHAAVALAALEDWGQRKHLRQKIYSNYIALFKEFGLDIKLQSFPLDRVHTLLPIRLKDGLDPNSVISGLKGYGIESRRWYYPLLNEFRCFSGGKIVDDLANAKAISKHVLGLPFYLNLCDDDMRYVVSTLAKLI